MKNMKKILKQTSRETTAVAVPVVIPSMYEPADPDYADAAERVRFHIREAQAHGRCAIAHIIEAGRELSIQKQLLGYGQWNTWCEEKLSIHRQTADRYIDTFQRTVGAARATQRIPLDAKLLKKELDAATVGMEEKTIRQAMLELGIIKRNPDLGGAGRGQGRKPKDEGETVAAKLDAIANNEALLWATMKGALDTLVKLDAERDVWNRLGDEHLSTAVEILADVAKKSSGAMMGRIGK